MATPTYSRLSDVPTKAYPSASRANHWASYSRCEDLLVVELPDKHGNARTGFIQKLRPVSPRFSSLPVADFQSRTSYFRPAINEIVTVQKVEAR